jgi:hypothetical protein
VAAGKCGDIVDEAIVQWTKGSWRGDAVAEVVT